MISCTEFIPAYSEGFKFIKKRGGSKQLKHFWAELSDCNLKEVLSKLITEDNIEAITNNMISSSDSQNHKLHNKAK